MNNRERTFWAMLLVAALTIPNLLQLHAQDDTTAMDVLELKKLIDKQVKAQNDEKLARYMQTIHPDSASYKQTQTGTKELFDLYDLSTKLRSFRFIGRDKTYAVVRVVTETRKEIGPDFKDNMIDVMQIVKKDGNQWKIYKTAVLGYRRLNAPAKKDEKGK